MEKPSPSMEGDKGILSTPPEVGMSRVLSPADGEVPGEAEESKPLEGGAS